MRPSFIGWSVLPTKGPGGELPQRPGRVLARPRARPGTGGLTLLRGQLGPLSEAELAIAQCIATVATSTVYHHRAQRSQAAVRDQLEAALKSRVFIEQAKGYLARTHHESPNDAFHRLRSYARGRQQRVVVAAEQVLSGGST